MDRFYSYVYLNSRKPGNYKYGGCKFPFEPFYVGKGCGDRFKPSSKIGGKWGNKYLKNKMKKIGLDNIMIEFLGKNMTNEEACELEKEIISLIGRWDLKTGPLLNMTDGGEGSVNISESQRKKLSEIQTRIAKHGSDSPRWGITYKHTPEAREKIRQAGIGRIQSRETRAKISKAHIGMKPSKETREKISRKIREITKRGSEHPSYGKKHSEETRAKIRASKKNMSDETRKNISKAAKRRPPISEETRARMSKASKGRRISDKTKEKMSIAAKGKKRSKEAVERMRQASLNSWAKRKAQREADK